jgi:hypothetical protein
MTWGVVIDVPAPVEVYDVLHAKLVEAAGGHVEGLLVHIGRPTGTGFQIIEVWESQEQADRANAELVGPLLAQQAGARGPAPAPGEQRAEPFDVHGLLLPPAGVFL